MSASITAKPDGFKRRISFSNKGGKVIIEPTLINPSDSAVLKTITANCQPSFVAIVDIEGISEISKDWTIGEYKRPIWLASLMVLSIGFWMFLSGNILNKYFSLNENIKSLIIVSVATAMFVFFSFSTEAPRAVSQIPEICRDIYNKATSDLP